MCIGLLKEHWVEDHLAISDVEPGPDLVRGQARADRRNRVRRVISRGRLVGVRDRRAD
jgi:hypothetical protein